MIRRSRSPLKLSKEEKNESLTMSLDNQVQKKHFEEKQEIKKSEDLLKF